MQKTIHTKCTGSDKCRGVPLISPGKGNMSDNECVNQTEIDTFSESYFAVMLSMESKVSSMEETTGKEIYLYESFSTDLW